MAWISIGRHGDIFEHQPITIVVENGMQLVGPSTINIWVGNLILHKKTGAKMKSAKRGMKRKMFGTTLFFSFLQGPNIHRTKVIRRADGVLVEAHSDGRMHDVSHPCPWLFIAFI